MKQGAVCRNAIVLDDNASDREYVCTILEIMGFKAYPADTGKKALQIVELVTPHLMVTDIVMPVCEGIETIVAARKMGVRCPIVVMSGANRKDVYLAIVKSLGVQGIIRKPFSRDELQTLVTRLKGIN